MEHHDATARTSWHRLGDLPAEVLRIRIQTPRDVVHYLTKPTAGRVITQTLRRLAPGNLGAPPQQKELFVSTPTRHADRSYGAQIHRRSTKSWRELLGRANRHPAPVAETAIPKLTNG